MECGKECTLFKDERNITTLEFICQHTAKFRNGGSLRGEVMRREARANKVEKGKAARLRRCWRLFQQGNNRGQKLLCQHSWNNVINAFGQLVGELWEQECPCLCWMDSRICIQVRCDLKMKICLAGRRSGVEEWIGPRRLMTIQKEDFSRRGGSSGCPGSH